MEKQDRIVWIDWLRVIAIFLVMVVHSTEPFYLGGDGSLILSKTNAFWAALFDSLARPCVPLFVIASSYLLFPLHYPTGTFFRKRVVRVLVPFAVWTVFYAFYQGEPASNFKELLFNFNYSAGHLWFVYMLVGIYLLMPLLSPWAEKVGKKELSVYLGIWLFTTLIPLVRDWLGAHPLAMTYGPTGIPRPALYPLWGEASWNAYGTFYYLSGFIGYMLLGLWLRKFGGELSKGSIISAIGCLAGGFTACFTGFLRRVNISANGEFPVGGPIDYGVWWETTLCNDTIGTALMTIGAILLIMRIKSDGKFYRSLIKPISLASYGMYLGHMVALAFFYGLFSRILESAPLTILCTAAASFTVSAAVAVAVRRIPKFGKIIIG